MTRILAILALVGTFGITACGHTTMTSIDETAGGIPVVGGTAKPMKADKAYSSSLRK